MCLERVVNIKSSHIEMMIDVSEWPTSRSKSGSCLKCWKTGRSFALFVCSNQSVPKTSNLW